MGGNVSLQKEHAFHPLKTLCGNIATPLFDLSFRVTLRPWALPVLFVCFSVCGFGQDPTESIPSEPLPNPSQILDPSPRVIPSDEFGRNEETPKPPEGEADTEELLAPVLGETLPRDEQVRNKKWRVIPFGRVGITADDNVFITPTNQEKDVYFTLTPGIAIGWGNYEKEVKALGEFQHYFEAPDFELDTELKNFVFAKYAPSVLLFSRLQGENAFDQDALVAGRWEFAKLTLGARVRYQTLTGSDFDTNSRTNRQILTAAINTAYDFSEKTSLEFNATNDTVTYKSGQGSGSRQVSQTLQDYTETILEDWVNYQWMPKTLVSLGGRVGFLELQTSPSQTYEQLLARTVFRASGKLVISIDGGTEFRQVKNGNSANLNSVFSFGASYQPFGGTTISATAFRRNSASVITPDENITSTGISARLKQRFFQRFYLGLEGSYRYSEYVSSATGAASGRKDAYIFAKSSVSFDITRHLSAEFAYQHLQDESSQSGSSFAENLVTAQFNLQF